MIAAWGFTTEGKKVLLGLAPGTKEDTASARDLLRDLKAHRKSTRTTNLVERLFGEERRRSKVILHAFGERVVMKLMFAALPRASESWRGIRITEFELRQLNSLRSELNEQFGARHAPIAQPINPASRSRISSNGGT